MDIVKKTLIALGVVMGFVFIFFICNVFVLNRENLFIQEVLKGAGTAIDKPPKEYSDDFAAEIIGLLLYLEDIQLISPVDARPMEPVSLLFDYGENGGKTLDLQKYINLNGSEYITVGIERPDGIKLRHKVQVGEYLKNWELIKKESNNSQTPFKRTYLFSGGKGEDKWLRGVVLYEGSMIELSFYGFVDDELVKKFETVTWNISKRIDNVYETHLRQISEGPLFVNDPIITRPDLPDLD